MKIESISLKNVEKALFFFCAIIVLNVMGAFFITIIQKI